ncbi:MAG TPA: hypothetical protein VFG04_06715 [Planctomycetaceae bacterium]|jgi:hypothetical protein|nr:hypothetical protein [Planctomycetaceae bacterium]
MRSPLSGSIATCLIFVPLVAVPLLAVLGMPQLSSNAPGAVADDVKLAADDPTLASGNSDLVAPVRVADSKTEPDAVKREPRSVAKVDPFAEFSRDSDDSRSATSVNGKSSQKRSNRWSEGNGLPQKALLSVDRPRDDHAASGPFDRPTSGGSSDEQAAARSEGETPAKTTGGRRALPEAAAVVALGSESATGTQTADASAEGRSSAAPPSASLNGSAWKRAVSRLNALGIRDYQLQPGERDGEFNFSCRFAARGNPRVIHRFEAEAADPLEAVNQVLRQLDDWRARHADRGQAARESASDAKLTSRAAESSEVEMTNRAF